MRRIIASSKPMFCPNLRRSAGSLCVTIEIKIILSNPSTISKKVSVSKLTQADVWAKTVKSKFIT